MLNNDEYFPRRDAEILWAWIEMVDTPAWRIQSKLLDFARPDALPEHRDSYNPLRRFAGHLGVRMHDRLTAKAVAVAEARCTTQP